MVRAGELSLVGEIDTRGIESGTRRINNQLGEVEAQTRQSNNTFQRLSSTAATIGDRFIKLGTAGVGALSGLATQSPAVAGHLADMRVNMRELSITAGESLEPAFETASSSLETFTNFMQDNEDTFRSITESITTGFSDAMEGAKRIWESFANTTDTITKSIGLEGADGGDLLDRTAAPLTAAGISRMLGARWRTAGLTGLGTGVFQEAGRESDDDTFWGDLASNIGFQAGAGATIGSKGGWWGTAAGGAGGTITGTATTLHDHDLITTGQLVGMFSPLAGLLYQGYDLFNDETEKKNATYISED